MTARAAARTVVTHARDVADARLLLDALGLVDEHGQLVEEEPVHGHGRVGHDVVLHEHQRPSTTPRALAELPPVPPVARQRQAKPVRPRPDRTKPAPRPARLTPVPRPSPADPPQPDQEVPVLSSTSSGGEVATGPATPTPSPAERTPAVGSPEWLLAEAREHPDRAVRRAAANGLATWCAARIAHEDLSDAIARAEKRGVA